MTLGERCGARIEPLRGGVSTATGGAATVAAGEPAGEEVGSLRGVGLRIGVGQFDKEVATLPEGAAQLPPRAAPA